MNWKHRTITVCVAGLGVLPQAAWAQCQYEVTIIQGPECGIFGPAPTSGRGLGEDGAVVGFYNECSTTSRAYRWTPETGVEELEFPFPTLSSRAYDIAGDWIVGEYDVSGDGLERIGFLFDGDEFIALDVPDGANVVVPLATNGTRATGYWLNTVVGLPSHAFIYENAELIDIHADLNPAMLKSRARAINTHGQVTGWSWPQFLDDGRAFIWDNGRAIELPPIPGGLSSAGEGINDRGDIVGQGSHAAPAGGTVGRGFVWSDGVMTLIHPPPDFPHVQVEDINNVRQVIGQYSGNGFRAFLWQHGAQTELNDLVPADPVLNIVSVREIDDDGRIVGTANLPLKGQQTVAVLLTPVGKPLGDIDNDCIVGVYDLTILLEQWGRRDSFADINGDNMVDPRDLAILLGSWGM